MQNPAKTKRNLSYSCKHHAKPKKFCKIRKLKNLKRTELFTRCMDRHETLHAARYNDSPDQFARPSKTNRGIERNRRTSVHLAHTCSGLSARPYTLRGYCNRRQTVNQVTAGGPRRASFPSHNKENRIPQKSRKFWEIVTTSSKQIENGANPEF